MTECLAWRSGKGACRRDRPQAPQPQRQVTRPAPKKTPRQAGDDATPTPSVQGEARVSQLCPEDKQKIGGLIRRLVDMKEQHDGESRQAREERERLDVELKRAHEQNLEILSHTHDLRQRFSSSLAILKAYKDRLHAQEARRTQQEQAAQDLQDELEKTRAELDRARQRNATSDAQASAARLQRLLDIQDQRHRPGKVDTVDEAVQIDVPHRTVSLSPMPRRSRSPGGAVQRDVLPPEPVDLDEADGSGSDDSDSGRLVVELNRHPADFDLLTGGGRAFGRDFFRVLDAIDPRTPAAAPCSPPASDDDDDIAHLATQINTIRY
ncbi:Uncharacterized protein PBTT_02797 [Plasmodiophora brassicae]